MSASCPTAWNGAAGAAFWPDPICFIIFGEFFGLMPATFTCVFVSALGDRTAKLKNSLILATGVTLGGAFLFSYVLKVPFPLFRLGH